MTGVTDDPNHPGIRRGAPDTLPVPQNDTYLVLSEAERAKGFVRPVRRSYVHVGSPGPNFPLRDLNEEERARWGDEYVKFEPYPADAAERAKHGIAPSATGRFWSQQDLDRVGKGCGTVTTMGQALAETYAREPGFYGATYCCGCSMHRPVGRVGEFVWDGTTERVGT